MGKDVNVAALMAVLRELFSRIAVTDLVFGLMEDCSSLLRSFKVLQHNGVLNTKHHHLTTQKVMGRQKQWSSQ